MSLNDKYKKPERIDENMPIFGENAIFDSLNMSIFFITVKRIINDEYNVPISLTDKKAMSQKKSPFRNIKTVYI